MTNAKRILSLGLAGCWLGSAGLDLCGREPSKTLADLAALEAKVRLVAPKVLPATVALIAEKTGSSGSGVVTTADGLILTGDHVVHGNKELMVVFPDGRQTQAKVLGANFSKDIAMVQITEKGPWPFVARGVSKPLHAGDWVMALGHSAGYDPDRTPPVRFGRVISDGPGNFLTTDCTLIGGDSGGPLFDLEGRIVGIHSNIGESVKNNNHAGIDGFAEDWDRLLAGESWTLSLNPFASPEMPVLGIEMEMARGTKGVIVAEVLPRSPAATAGVKIGDMLQTVDGSAIRDGFELRALLAKKQAGDRIKLGLLRDDGKLELTVTLARQGQLFDQR